MAVLHLDDCSTNRAPGRLLRRIDKLMAAYVESRFEGKQLSYMHWVALKVVRDGTVGNAGELARELAITTGATTRMIDTLERHGLLERDRSAADRRVVRLAVTEAGRVTIEELHRPVVDAWNDVLAEFDQADVDRMISDLIRLLAAAERVVGANGMAEAAE